MNELEQLRIQLAREGYRIHLHYQQDRWQCELLAGVAVLPAYQARPLAYGATAIEAVRAANELRLSTQMAA
jgi:hypothetical protein